MKFKELEAIVKDLLAIKPDCQNCVGGWVACRDCQANAKYKASYKQQADIVGEEQLQLVIKYVTLQTDIAREESKLDMMRKERSSLLDIIQEKCDYAPEPWWLLRW